MQRKFSITIDLSCSSTGFVVVDSATNDTSSGGIRICSDLDLDEIALLAREMTLKFSFAGLGRGGAKSGIRIPVAVTSDEKLTICEEFGRRLGPIIRKGIYYPGMDMNCGPEELQAVYRGAGIALGPMTDTSFFTAISVAASLEALRMHSKPDRPLTLAIEGFGNVAAHLARRLSEDSFKIVAISTLKGAIVDWNGFDHRELVSARKEHGDRLTCVLPGERLEHNELLAADVDILVPAARVLSITSDNASLVRARSIVPVANAPCSAEAFDMLHAGGTVCLPGFVTNSGGVFASGLYDSGVSVRRIEQTSASLYCSVVLELLELGVRTGFSPVHLAEKIACERLRVTADTSGTAKIAEKVVRGMSRFGICPRWLGGKIAARRFDRSMMDLLTLIRDWKE